MSMRSSPRDEAAGRRLGALLRALRSSSLTAFTFALLLVFLVGRPALASTAQLGDFVWHDLNANGIQEPGEPGVPGVTVRLLLQSGAFTGRTEVTDANGRYLFTNLNAGNWRVQFVLPAGYVFSPRNVGNDDTVDSDANISTGRTQTVTLAELEKNLTLDAGIHQCTAAIGDFVWSDLNANGIQDAGEPGIPGVKVDLINSNNNVVDSTTTDVDGIYGFGAVPEGDYCLKFTAPNGYVISPKDAGADDVDSDADATTGKTALTNLVCGEHDMTWDCGMYQPASIGDFVWHDLNADGVQDAGEPGVPNVTVNLFDASNNLVGTTTTDASGLYLFSGLAPGSYCVQFVAPSGYKISPKDATGDSSDSDADPTTGKADLTALDAGETDLDWDCGLYKPASIGDLVFLDANANGVQDGEAGVSGVTVELYDGANNLVGTTTTDANGVYGFGNLTPGTYCVKFILPNGYVFSPQDQGGDDAKDSDANTSTGKAAATSLTSGENDTTWDAGVYQPATIGDRFWEDKDADGKQDPGEPGIPGVTVELCDSNGNTIATTTTDADGKYSFTNLPPGDYCVKFVPPADCVLTLKDNAADDEDSDADPTTGVTAMTHLDSGEVDLTWDAGCYHKAKIGDFVWFDADMDGIQDQGESGIAGVTVELYDGANNLVATTTTDSDGKYCFGGLTPGSYCVKFVAPAGYTISPKDQGGDDEKDSDADPGTGKADATVLESGETDLTWDAGMFALGCIGDFVWHDTNIDGIQDPGELGVPNVTVELLDENGNVIATTTTDANGKYLFCNLPAGTYSVRIVKPAGYDFSPADQGGDDQKDSDANTTTGETGQVTIGPGENNLSLDGGLWLPACLGDRVWLDLDGDGIQDQGETGIVGVTVILKDANGNVLATTTTGGDGIYGFCGLKPGQYEVCVDPASLPANLVQSYDLDGLATPHCADVDLNYAENRTDVDFGYRPSQPQGNGATRTPGYWQTHLKAMQYAVSQGCMNLGILLYNGGASSQDLTNATVGDVLAIMWGNIAKQGTAKRSALGQARMQLGQQLVAALANLCVLGTVPEQWGYSPTLIQDAIAALDGMNVDLIKSYIGQVDGFNNAGDAVPLDANQSQIAGPADPQGAKAAAKKTGGVIDPGPAFR